MFNDWAHSKAEDSGDATTSNNGSDNSKRLDDFIFIDATAFLSGRLEDRLRYPRLDGTNNRGSKGPPGMSTTSTTLPSVVTVRMTTSHFGLYAQWDNNEPKRIEQLEDEDPPFQQSKDQQGCFRVFNLMTRPLRTLYSGYAC